MAASSSARRRSRATHASPSQGNCLQLAQASELGRIRLAAHKTLVAHEDSCHCRHAQALLWTRRARLSSHPKRVRMHSVLGPS
jgi:hypothetical protein